MLFFFAIIGLVFSTLGVDISQKVSSSSFKCMKDNGYSFAIVRCYRSVGSVDPNCVNNVKNAWVGGMRHVDAYLFPCPKCKSSGKQQVIDTVNNLKKNGAKFGMIWLDIEGSQYWLGDKNKNRDFFQSLIQGVKETKVNAGVYSSKYQWGTIMGDDYKGGSNYPIWYAHYDWSPNFSDFRSFGGWTKPSIKQYQGDTTLCGSGVDLNYY